MPGNVKPRQPTLCTSLTVKGAPCTNHAKPGSDPPRCSTHLGTNKRGTSLTTQRHERFTSLMRAGNAFDTCARAVGVAPSTARTWYRQGAGAAAGEPFRTFRLDVDRADAEAESRNVAIVATAARESWQAAAWLLERTHPERWARISQREKAAELKEPEQPHDPFSEVDELAERRRTV